MGELATAVQEKLAVVAIVFDDAAYTAVKRAQQERFAGRFIATDLVSPDFAALARAFGAEAAHAGSPDELRGAIGAALHRAGPTLIEVPLPHTVAS